VAPRLPETGDRRQETGNRQPAAGKSPAVVAAAAVLVAATLAAAGPVGQRVVDPELRYRVELPMGWTRAPVADPPAAAPATRVVAVWRGVDGSELLVISRIAGPTEGAWRAQPGFFDAVERGVERGAAGYARLSRREHRIDGVPAMDLWYRGRGAEGAEVVVGMRFLFFRRGALALAVEAPAGRSRRAPSTLRAIVDAFRPIVDTPR
jgi:hypothetical protein